MLVLALMSSISQHTIKMKCYSSIKCTSQSQQMNLFNFLKESRFNKVYNIHGELGPLCDM